MVVFSALCHSRLFKQCKVRTFLFLLFRHLLISDAINLLCIFPPITTFAPRLPQCDPANRDCSCADKSFKSCDPPAGNIEVHNVFAMFLQCFHKVCTSDQDELHFDRKPADFVPNDHVRQRMDV